MFVHHGSSELLPGWPLKSWKVTSKKWLNTWAGRQERSKRRETQWQNLGVRSSQLVSSGIGVGFESKQQWNKCKHACVYRAEICAASDLLGCVLGLSVARREREKRGTHQAVRARGMSCKQVGTWSTTGATAVCPHIPSWPCCCWRCNSLNNAS